PGVERVLQKLEREYAQAVVGWKDLPTPMARETAKKMLEETEVKITDLKQQASNMADRLDKIMEETESYMDAYDRAEAALNDIGSDNRAKASALAEIIDRIECRFEPTGKRWPTSVLKSIRFVPTRGQIAEYPITASGCTA